MSLEDIEKELYGQKDTQEPLRKRISVAPEDATPLKREPVASPWEHEEEKDNTKSPGKYRTGRMGRVLIITLSALLLALTGIAAYYLYQYFTTRDIEVSLEAPEEALVGVPFNASISVNNLSDRQLQSPRLSIMLPEGVLDAQDPSRRTISFDIEPLAPKQSVSKQAQLVITGAAFQTYQLDGVISYGYDAGTLSSRFEKKAQYGIAAHDPVLSLDFSAPERVMNGEEFEMRVRYQNIGDAPISHAVLVFDVPESFGHAGSGAALDKGEIVIDTIEPHAENTVSVTGRVSEKDFSFMHLGVTARVRIADQDIDIAHKDATVSIIPASLALTLKSEKKVVYPGETVQYTLSYTNNTDTALADVIAVARFTSPLFDVSSLQGGGYYSDADRSMTWTAANIPELKQLQPHQSGAIRFSVRLLSEYPSSQDAVARNLTVAIEASMTSPTVPANAAVQQAVGAASLEQRMGGKIGFSQAVYFNEPYSDIRNGGSLPPRVGVPVNYTIHWRLASYGTDHSQASVRAMLGSGVRWTGKVKVLNAQAAPTYNERTQEVVWELGEIRAIAQDGQYPEAVFQVEFTPSSIVIGKQFEIIGAAHGEATDTFAGEKRSLNAQALSSANLSDASLPSGFQQVAN